MNEATLATANRVGRAIVNVQSMIDMVSDCSLTTLVIDARDLTPEENKNMRSVYLEILRAALAKLQAEFAAL